MFRGASPGRRKLTLGLVAASMYMSGMFTLGSLALWLAAGPDSLYALAALGAAIGTGVVGIVTAMVWGNRGEHQSDARKVEAEAMVEESRNNPGRT